MPMPPPDAIRIPIPTGGSGSICTAICGTRAGPTSSGPGPGPIRRRAGAVRRWIRCDGVVRAVRERPEKSRWDAAWALLVRAMETGAPDLVVVPATTLASLRREEWDVPASIDRLAGAVSLSRRADQVAARTAAVARAGR